MSNDPIGLKPPGLANTPFYVRERKDFAIEQEIYRHNQAMYSLGEPVMFVLMWTVEDFKNGYVRRCQRCYDNRDPLLAQASKVYNQPTQNKCPMCYGTTFEGGVRAKIIRPAVISDTDDDEQKSRHGVTYPQTINVESTSDFRWRSGDFVFRADGSRWQLSAPSRETIRTGFAHPSQAADAVGYASSTASFEDRTSVAWMIPPDEEDLVIMLAEPRRYPVAETDQLNGPLIPDSWTD